MPDKPKTRAEATAYLRDVLRMNPMESSAAIMSRRGLYLGTRKAKDTETSDEKNIRRQRARRLIDHLRQQFWTIDPEQLRKQLNALNVRDFPELQPAVDRLRLVSTFRTEFVRLDKHPKTHKHLFFHFKRIMMLTPREAGSVKDEFLLRVADGGSLIEIKTMVKMMKSEFPELYKAEADWLNAVAKTKDRSKQRDDVGGGVAFEFEIPGWLIGIIVLVLIRVVMVLIR